MRFWNILQQQVAQRQQKGGVPPLGEDRVHHKQDHELLPVEAEAVEQLTERLGGRADRAAQRFAERGERFSAGLPLPQQRRQQGGKSAGAAGLRGGLRYLRRRRRSRRRETRMNSVCSRN